MILGTRDVISDGVMVRVRAFKRDDDDHDGMSMCAWKSASVRKLTYSLKRTRLSRRTDVGLGHQQMRAPPSSRG